MADLTGRVAVVTGGNGGIGLGMARALAEAGADIAIWGRNETKNAAARAELEATGRRVVALACDVADEAQVIAATARTIDELGRIDALFANAGIGGYSRFVDMSLDEWRRVMRVNLDGAFLTLREAAKHMVERGDGGALVAVSSTSAIHGAPGHGALRRQQGRAHRDHPRSRGGVGAASVFVATRSCRDGPRPTCCNRWP